MRDTRLWESSMIISTLSETILCLKLIKGAPRLSGAPTPASFGPAPIKLEMSRASSIYRRFRCAPRSITGAAAASSTYRAFSSSRRHYSAARRHGHIFKMRYKWTPPYIKRIKMHHFDYFLIFHKIAAKRFWFKNYEYLFTRCWVL